VLEELATRTANQGFAQMRVVIGARNDQIGGEVGSAREQDVGYRKPTPHGFFGNGVDAMPLQMTGDALDRRQVLLKFPLVCADKHNGGRLRLFQQMATRHSKARCASRVRSQATRMRLLPILRTT